MLQFMLQRLHAAAVDDLVVATSTEPADDAIEAAAKEAGVACVRGPEDDVLERFAVAIREHPCDTVVRLTGDCPLIDPEIVGAALAVREATGAAYVSNTLIRTFPDGLDVEVMSRDALLAAADEAHRTDEREHVTPFIYRNPERFRLAALRTPLLAGAERWTVDTADDLDFVREVVSLVRDHGLGWGQILSRVGRRAVPQPGTVWLRPVIEADGDRLLEWRNDPTAVTMSRSGVVVDPVDHERWFASAVDDPARRIWIGEVDGAAIGQVRVDVSDGGHGLVSVAVDAAQRGKGHATALLRALWSALQADLQVVDLLAEVHPENKASLAAFRRAGYAEAGSADGFIQLMLHRD